MRLVQLSLSTSFLALGLVEARNTQWIHDCSVKAFKFCPLGPRFNAYKWQDQYYHCMCDNWRTIDSGWYDCPVGCYRDIADDFNDFGGDYHAMDAYCTKACGERNDCPAHWGKC
ncbi:hypothetical protein CF319_g8534 [Tilletia indica]|uniref:Uncharacterized protein n=1 Tax=Tilletia indica TaxID=43049 RepID=A0A177T5W2_9BASI|nr:hypothetical protein CF319_g8534 [Tilletia indica]KAE8245466.1 hypothetical protein A4X13_0g5901 [Tilletia indica]